MATEFVQFDHVHQTELADVDDASGTNRFLVGRLVQRAIADELTELNPFIGGIPVDRRIRREAQLGKHAHLLSHSVKNMIV